MDVSESYLKESIGVELSLKGDWRGCQVGCKQQKQGRDPAVIRSPFSLPNLYSNHDILLQVFPLKHPLHIHFSASSQIRVASHYNCSEWILIPSYLLRWSPRKQMSWNWFPFVLGSKLMSWTEPAVFLLYSSMPHWWQFGAGQERWVASARFLRSSVMLTHTSWSPNNQWAEESAYISEGCTLITLQTWVRLWGISTTARRLWSAIQQLRWQRRGINVVCMASFFRTSQLSLNSWKFKPTQSRNSLLTVWEHPEHRSGQFSFQNTKELPK